MNHGSDTSEGGRGGVVQYFEHPPRSYLYTSSASLGPGPEPTDSTSYPDDVAGGRASSSGSSAKGKAPSAGRKKALSPLLLTGLMYTFTMSGAYGIEESVMGGGPFLAILSIIIIPILMAFPSAVVVAEMASAVPSNAGFLMWINLAYHRIIYMVMCILSLLLIFIDNALYPVLFSEYFCTAISCSTVTNRLLRVGMILVTYILNLLGIEAVGVASVFLTIITVSPFLLMYLVEQLSNKFYLNWPAIAFIPKNIDWVTFITTASWNLSGIEQAGAVAEEIQDPQRTILRALVPLIGLAFITYIPPVLTGASTSHGALDISEWETGFWSVVAYRIGGDGLKYFTVVGSVLSAFGLTLSAICTTTSLIGGMAQTELFPGPVGRWLSQRNRRFGSYHWALTVNTVLTAVFSTLLDFSPLVKLDQFLYGIRIVAIFGAFFIFRHRYPLLKRPYRVPLDGWKLYAAFAIPTLSFAALAVVGMLVDVQTVIICMSVLGGCIAFSTAYCLLYRRKNFEGRIVTIDPRREQ